MEDGAGDALQQVDDPQRAQDLRAGLQQGRCLLCGPIAELDDHFAHPSDKVPWMHLQNKPINYDLVTLYQENL